MSLSLRARAMITFSLILLSLMVAGGAILVSNARQGVEDETQSSLELARQLATAAIITLNATHGSDVTLADLPDLLPQPRHVSIHIFGLSAKYVNIWRQNAVLMSVANDRAAQRAPPLWFDRLVRPERIVERIPLVVSGRPLGRIMISTDPSAEIAKVWQNARALALLMLAGFILSIVMTYFAIWSALSPLQKISDGVRRMESGDYETRIEPVNVPELNEVAYRVNALGAALNNTIRALDHSAREKKKLAAKLVTVQDTERKKIALELHDEFGPCLFGIKSNATFLKSQITNIENGCDRSIVNKVDTILNIAGHMQTQNKALLHRLRPMALDKFGLTHLLEKTAAEFREREPRINWALSIQDDIDSNDETTDLTIFRVMQESMTNAARHSQASEVHVVIDRQKDGDIKIEISDDGVGIPTSKIEGHGLSGMKERVSALGGNITIKQRRSGGTTVTALVPSTPRVREASVSSPQKIAAE